MSKVTARSEGKKVGFMFMGQFITNPYMDETMRKAVNPYHYYGRHYLASPFFEPLNHKIFQMIHTQPDYQPSISYVDDTGISEDYGWSKEEAEKILSMSIDEQYIAEYRTIFIKRMV